MSGPFGASQWMYNASSGFYDFEISNSLRFNTASNTYLEKDSYTHNRQIFTYSFWFKPTNPTVRQFIFGRYSDGNNVSVLEYDGGANAQLSWYDYQSGYTFQQRTTALFRDVSAWYHVVLRVDTTDGTAGNRARMYVNGTEQTSFTASTTVNQNVSFLLGDGGNDFRWGTEGSNNRLWYGGYLAEINVIDGTSYAPSAFAETKNDIWIPKDTSGLTFGTNGYRLQFKQTGTGQDSSGIGADTGGNDNHFAVANLTAVDVVPDSPTNNFCTINFGDQIGSNTVSEGNLKTIGGGDTETRGTISLGNGKWYWEVRAENYAHNMFGISEVGQTGVNYHSTNNGISYYGLNGYKYVQASGASYGASYGNGDIIGHAYDGTNNTLTYYKNNSSQGALTVPDVEYVPSISGAAAHGGIFNFGQDSSFAGAATAQNNADENDIGDFYYSPPSGFLALCTANLPAPAATIDPAQGGSPQDYFNTALYSGTGSLLAVTTGFQPDWTWIKQRNGTNQHVVQDSVRGNFVLYPDSAQAEGATGGGWITETSTGFTADANGPINTSGDTYVAWSWKAGGSGSSNTNGTINTTATSVAEHGGFSISTYTGTGSNATVGHGLSSAPILVMTKRRNDTENWVIGSETSGTGFTGRILLDENEAWADTDAQWRDTAPSSTVVTIGTHNSVNGSSSDTYVMYCFANVDGMQKIGQYTGNGNADGTFVHTGFRPAFVMVKSTGVEQWIIHDNKRDIINPNDAVLYADATTAEDVNPTYRNIDILSNGFKQRSAQGQENGDGLTYIYMAFAEQPFKYANAK